MNDNLKKYIWEGAVGVSIQERTNKQTGETFHSFEFVRCYKTPDSDEMKYSTTFTERNAEALGRVIQKTLRYCADAQGGEVPGSEPAKHIVGKIDIAQVPAEQATN